MDIFSFFGHCCLFRSVLKSHAILIEKPAFYLCPASAPRASRQLTSSARIAFFVTRRQSRHCDWLLFKQDRPIRARICVIRRAAGPRGTRGKGLSRHATQSAQSLFFDSLQFAYMMNSNLPICVFGMKMRRTRKSFSALLCGDWRESAMRCTYIQRWHCYWVPNRVLNKHYMVSIRVSFWVPNRGGMHSVYISIIISFTQYICLEYFNVTFLVSLWQFHIGMSQMNS